MPDTSNRKPRIANRVKIGNGLVEAYKTFKPFPSVQEFRERIAGKTVTNEDGSRTVYPKLIGYEEIIEIVANYLFGWEYAVKKYL